MSNYYLAVDVGASNGRCILSHLDNGKMILEEVHRFENGMSLKDNHLSWNLDQLFAEILVGMKKCKELGKIPVSVGVDTWAVDFVLLDKNDNFLGGAIAYRDSRTAGMDEAVYAKMAEDKLYARTGIQKQIFNTVYQLEAVKRQNPFELAQAESLLLIPDYFHFLLSGVKRTEYTNATTTQLVSPVTKDWDWELIRLLEFPVKIFNEIIPPGTVLGSLKPEVRNIIGYDCNVVVPATHDTASAVISVPSERDEILYISSGTWSLMGTERLVADVSETSRKANFTNEGGINTRFRYLKNIMGLWMIQQVRKELEYKYSFERLSELASEETVKSIVNVNDRCFLAPSSMIKALQDACRETHQRVPVTPGELASVIYNSLSVCYRETLQEIEALTGITYEAIHIIGGGANADYLNRLCAKYTKRTVLAGPAEATSAGNIAVQMLANQELKDLKAIRRCIRHSFEIRIYENMEESS